MAEMTMVHRDGKIYRLGVKHFPNRDRYEGEFLDGRREGQGVLSYANGDRYEGAWENNRCHGSGVFTSPDFMLLGEGAYLGRRYEGSYEFGTKQGLGLLHVGDGDVYEGGFREDLYSGAGTLSRAGGDKLMGNFVRGKICGAEGRVEFANGDLFEGALRAGRFHGRGTYAYAHGRGTYEGDYFNGKQHGQGKRVFANGSSFEGAFVEGRIAGEGMMAYANNNQYVGIWKDDLPHGRGVMMYAHGDRFEGNFERGLFCGRGRYTWADGGYYEGEYLDRGRGAHSAASGLRNGYGVRVWVSGNRYEGAWVDDRQEGEGKFQAADGREHQGTYRASLKKGLGSERWGNQLGVPYRCGMHFKHRGNGYCFYSGDFAHDHMHGQGKFVCMDGREYEGGWRLGKRHGRGTMVLCPTAERGDERRRFIGGLDGLYRALRYEGAWLDGERAGHGRLEMMDGQLLEGHFENGLLEGPASVTFRDGVTRPADYSRGYRVNWTAKAQQLDDGPDGPSKRPPAITTGSK